MHQLPRGLVVRIRRSHRRGRGSIPRTGTAFFFLNEQLQGVAIRPFCLPYMLTSSVV